MSSVVLALVVSVAAIVMTARRHAAAPIVVAERTLSRVLRVMVRALGVAFAAATLALCFSQGASAQSEEPPAEPATDHGQGAAHANENSAHADEPEAPAEPAASESPAVEDPPAADEAPVAEPPAADETPAAEPPAAAVASEPAAAEPTATEAPGSTATPAAEPAGPSPSDAIPAADPASDSTPAATGDPDTASGPTAGQASGSSTAKSTWTIDLSGTATITKRGNSITIDYADPSIPDETRSLASVSDIVVNGSSGADRLTIGGNLGAALRFDGGDGDDALDVSGPGSTVRMNGSRQGEVRDEHGDSAVSFAGVDDVLGGSGGTTYVVGGPSDLRRLNLGPTDRLVVDLASAALLRLQEIILDGKLEIRGNGNSVSSALKFLAFDSSSGDFADFSGLDRGHGGYFRPVNDGSGYGLDQANLPDGIVITFSNADAGDPFWAYLSGKANTLAPGTEITIDLLDHQITGDLTLGGSADAATLGLDGVQLSYGDPGAPLYVLTDADGATLLLTRTNLSGQLNGSVTTAIPGVTFDGTFTVDLDSDDGAITATGTGITVTVAGHTFTGVDLSLTGVQGAGGRSMLVTGGNGATVTFGGAGGPLLATLLGDFELLLTAAGAELTAPVSLTSVIPGLAVPTGTFQLRLDSNGASLTSDAATLPIAGGSLSGAMTLYGVTTAAGLPALALDLTGTLALLDAMGPLIVLGGAAGAFLLTAGGVAGSGSGHTTFNVAGLPIDGSPLTLELNSTTAPVAESFVLYGHTTTIQARGPPAGAGIASVLPVITITVSGAAGPSSWLVDLSGPSSRAVALAVDGTDLVLSLGNVAVRRPLADLAALVITGSSGDDTLHLLTAQSIPVSFDGAGGSDTVRGPAVHTTWLVTAAGAGTVGTVTFSGIEHLTGAAGNQDTFAFTAGGSLAGLVSGGDGGWDTMRFDDGAANAITYVPSGPDSGRVLVGGRTFDFAGLEPVSSNVTVSDVTVTFGTPGDTIVLTTLANGNIALQATGAEDIDFAAPTGTLTINVGDGLLTIQGNVNLGGATLTVNNARTITVTGTLTAGTVVLNATERATIQTGAVITATGDLTIAVSAELSSSWVAGVPFIPTADTAGQLEVQAASLRGANITLRVDATVKKFGQFELDELRLAQFLDGLSPGMAEGTLVTFVDGGDDPDTITREEGSWIDDGFVPDTTIRVSNSASNNGFFKVTGVTATTLTLDAAAELTAEEGDSEVVIEAVIVPEGDPTLTLGAQIVIRDAGDWLDDGFRRGQTVRIEGTPDTDGDGEGDNDGEYALIEVTATTLTLDAGPGLVNQAGLTGVKIWAQGNPAILPIAVVDQEVALQPEVVELEFKDNGATGDTIVRTTGSWIDDGFAAGQFAIVDGPTVNRGSYLITAVTATELTIADPGTLTNEKVARGVEVASIALFGGATSSSLPTLTFKDDKLTRSSGSWTDDGFAVGQTVEIAGTKSNNGKWKISAITATELTLTAATFTEETTSDNETDPEVVAVQSLMNPELTFADKKITRSRGSWIADGFEVGDRITIHGGTVNQGQFVITALTATEMTLDLDDSAPFVKEMLRDVEVNRLLPYDVVEQPGDPFNLGKLAEALMNKLAGTGILGMAAYWAQVMTQAPSSSLTIGSGADIQATGNVTATATTNSQLRLRTDSLWIGVNYGRSSATATLTVAGGARIAAGAAVLLATNITNELRVGAIVTTGINARLIYAMKLVTEKAGLLPGPALTAAVGVASSLSNTTVADGALIEGADVTITASNSNDFRVTANSAVRGLAKANTGVAIAVVVSTIDSDANVSVGGTVRTTGDLTVTARSVGVYNYADARTTLKADKGPGIGGGKSAKVAEALKDIKLEPTSDPSAISAAASVVVANSSNDARAVIAPNARISVRGDLLVSAYAEDNLKSYAIAIGTLESKPDASGSIATVSLAGAVVVSNYHNGATARIGDGAIVNVADSLTVRAEAVIPSQLTLDDLFQQLLSRPIWSPPPSPDIDTSDPLTIAQQVSDAAKAYLAWVKDSATAPLGFINGVARPIILMAKYLPNRLVTTNVGALSGGKKVKKDDDGNPQEEDRTTAAISGTVTVFSVSNTANASIGTGALVNVQPDPDFAVTAAATQRVEVVATTDARLINLAGLVQPVELKAFLLGIGTTGKVGIGGTYQGVTVSLSARATIEDGAQVAALTDVDVTAFNRSFIVVVTQQGGNATQVGISGAFTLLDQTSVAQALIEDTAVVDTGGDLNVTATNDLLAVTISAVIQRGGRVAVGVGIAVNSFDNTTKALIAGVAGVPSPVATVGVAGDLTITALSDVTLYAFGAAAAQPLTEKHGAVDQAQPVGDDQPAEPDRHRPRQRCRQDRVRLRPLGRHRRQLRQGHHRGRDRHPGHGDRGRRHRRVGDDAGLRRGGGRCGHLQHRDRWRHLGRRLLMERVQRAHVPRLPRRLRAADHPGLRDGGRRRRRVAAHRRPHRRPADHHHRRPGHRAAEEAEPGRRGPDHDQHRRLGHRCPAPHDDRGLHRGRHHRRRRRRRRHRGQAGARPPVGHWRHRLPRHGRRRRRRRGPDHRRPGPGLHRRRGDGHGRRQHPGHDDLRRPRHLGRRGPRHHGPGAQPADLGRHPAAGGERRRVDRRRGHRRRRQAPAPRGRLGRQRRRRRRGRRLPRGQYRNRPGGGRDVADPQRGRHRRRRGDDHARHEPAGGRPGAAARRRRRQGRPHRRHRHRRHHAHRAVRGGRPAARRRGPVPGDHPRQQHRLLEGHRRHDHGHRGRHHRSVGAAPVRPRHRRLRRHQLRSVRRWCRRRRPTREQQRVEGRPHAGRSSRRNDQPRRVHLRGDRGGRQHDHQHQRLDHRPRHGRRRHHGRRRRCGPRVGEGQGRHERHGHLRRGLRHQRDPQHGPRVSGRLDPRLRRRHHRRGRLVARDRRPRRRRLARRRDRWQPGQLGHHPRRGRGRRRQHDHQHRLGDGDRVDPRGRRRRARAGPRRLRHRYRRRRCRHLGEHQRRRGAQERGRRPVDRPEQDHQHRHRLDRPDHGHRRRCAHGRDRERRRRGHLDGGHPVADDRRGRRLGRRRRRRVGQHDQQHDHSHRVRRLDDHRCR